MWGNERLVLSILRAKTGPLALGRPLKIDVGSAGEVGTVKGVVADAEGVATGSPLPQPPSPAARANPATTTMAMRGLRLVICPP
ncbi:unannotated protein [freshwater metagenome]|uniref:Unannotated protein n=1 Tax=freshwater metagenome TaxID=449393 RepID=A0A6J6ILX8_9ZZZZ